MRVGDGGERIFTHASDGYAGRQLCECSECGLVERCVPSFDFYVREGDATGSLVCQNCLHGFRRQAAGAKS